MKLQQLSVFIENKPGQLSVPCRALAGVGINILTMALADTDQFGILRLIVKDWEKAKEALTAGGCVVKLLQSKGIHVVEPDEVFEHVED